MFWRFLNLSVGIVFLYDAMKKIYLSIIIHSIIYLFIAGLFTSIRFLNFPPYYPIYTVFDVVQSPPPLSSPPCKFGKILVVDHFVEKIYIENFRIRNYFKKDFLNFSFHYVRYCNHLVTFFEKFPHQFAFASSQSS